MIRPAACWPMLSGGLALALGGAALYLVDHASALTGLAVVLPAAAFASLAALGFRRDPAGALPLAAPPPEWHGDDYGTGESDEPVLPVIAFSAYPVVSVADGRPVAAVAIEPNFRLPDFAYCTPEAIAWESVPPALAARLDATLLERAVARAEAADGRVGGEAVIVSVAAGSLLQTGFAARLMAALDGGDDRDDDGTPRAKLVVLIRGGAAEAAEAISGLPRSWRQHLGLHLTSPPADEAELERCLAAEPGCVEVAAPLLDAGAVGADLTRRLLERVAATNVPVVVSGVVDPALLRRLRAYPVRFARGPVFGPRHDLAAA